MLLCGRLQLRRYYEERERILFKKNLKKFFIGVIFILKICLSCLQAIAF
jgi:hypothetical protein